MMENYFRNTLTPPSLDLSIDRYAAWKTWKQKWNDFVMITNLRNEDAAYVAAMIRYTFTDETRNIYESLSLSEDENKDPAIILQKLEEFARGLVNETLERHNFNSRRQEENESFDDFLTEIKLLSKNCNYCENCYPGLLRDRIVAGVRSDTVRKKLLSENELTIERTINVCRAAEKANEGMESLKNEEDKEAKLAWLKGKSKNSAAKGMNSYSLSETKCKFCLRQHQFGRKNCPAWGKRCHECNEVNHFAKSVICKRDNVEVGVKGIQGVEAGVGALFLGEVGTAGKVPSSTFEVSIMVEETKQTVKMKIDTGADVTVIGRNHLETFGVAVNKLQQPNKKLVGPDKHNFKCYGCFTTILSYGNRQVLETVFVCDYLDAPLLGQPAINSLELISVNAQLNEIETETDIVREFGDVLKG